jgi:hypothetical protein
MGRGTGMDCVACGSAAVTERSERTAQGYRRFRCRECGKQYNERSGGVLNHTHGVVQNLPFLGYTDVQRAPACEGRISTGDVSCVGGGQPPQVKPAGAEAVPGPAG